MTPRTRNLLLAAPATSAVALVILVSFFWQPHTPTSEDARKDAKRVAYEVARDIALATDDGVANDETPHIPECEEALRDPTDRVCREYGAALEDFLEDAQEPCIGAGYLRAEDLSCVHESFYYLGTRGDGVRTGHVGA